ncbi:Oidioi.mRNA.OKI2018_I69.XSR.g16758.t1.cds [Oikopleura dioica]|uniref:Oidioi.mRNA.OKI2018_I69.XSR.g16758.t1.cds n=1 Tax=Oikopleura dioica TaxID=34765 RepID=A0ABN7SLB7_OIKDI|nr:Oidioi.mRNA.OKI2018_I69.XSR.g16758.t1.cds [Oikopleura dioica]
MKKWLVFGKWIQSSGALPPRQFYTQEGRLASFFLLFVDFKNRVPLQFRNKKGKLKLIEPPAEEIKVFFEAGASRGGGQKMNRTHSMARVVHVPTKTTARCQDTRWPKENEELALLHVRYQLDKKVNENGVVAQYEKELEEFLKMEEIENQRLREEELVSFREERDAQIDNFQLRRKGGLF